MSGIFREAPPVWRWCYRRYLLVGVSLLALLVAGCSPAPPTVKADAAIATASAKAAPAIVAKIPGASPTLVHDAACASPVIASMASDVAAAPAGSTTEQEAIQALTDGLATWLAENASGAKCN